MKGIKYLALAALCVIGMQTASFAYPIFGQYHYYHHRHHHHWW